MQATEKVAKMLFAFKEFGLQDGPSIIEAFSSTAYPEKRRIVRYLENGERTIASPGVYIDVVTGENTGIGKCHLTDGEYVWTSIIPYYVEKYNMILPDEFVEKVLSVPEK